MEIEHHGIWNEKYRPTSLDTYIGNVHLKSKVSIFIETNDPPHLLFYGRSGTGKTTISKIIAIRFYNTSFTSIGCRRPIASKLSGIQSG